jgi:hypothetical protein
LVVTAFKHVVAFPVGEMAHRVMEGFRRIAGTYSHIIADLYVENPFRFQKSKYTTNADVAEYSESLRSSTTESNMGGTFRGNAIYQSGK